MFSKKDLKITVNVIAVCILLMLGVVGAIGACSGAKDIPTSPEAQDVPIADGAAGERQLWGYYSGYAHPEEGIFRIEPNRSAGMHLNLVPTTNELNNIAVNVIWAASDMQQGLITVNVTLNNPFSSLPRYTGFDVRGIFITGASQVVKQGFSTAGDAHPQLLNPDGFTRWWNPTEFSDPGSQGYVDGNLGAPGLGGYDSKINGFKIFADGLGITDLASSLSVYTYGDYAGRASFSDSANTRRYELKFPPGQSYFNYAIDASWAPPSVPSPSTPGDFPAGANTREPWYMEIFTNQNTLEYHTDTGATSGSLVLGLAVYDWQGYVNGLVSDEIAQINIYSNELFGGAATVQATLSANMGMWAVYTADISAISAPTAGGTYTIWAEAVSANGTYKQGSQPAPDEAPAAYAAFDVDIAETTGGPGVLKTFGIKAWVLRNALGQSPAISDAVIDQHIAYANEFWSRYGVQIELHSRGFINSSMYLNLLPASSNILYNMQHDSTGLINVYYVNTLVGQGGAFAMIPCLFQNNTGASSYICYDSTDCAGLTEVLTHELGHIIGLLEDTYLLDQGFTCSELANQFCGGNTDLFCDPANAVWGNMMYFIDGNPGTPSSYYSLGEQDIEMLTPTIDSQGENLHYFHATYPSNFRDVGVP